MSRYILEIDETKCWGCKTCEAACKEENKAPWGVKLIAVGEDGPVRGDDGKLRFKFTVKRCLHCEHPACVEVCPAGALIRRADGLVILSPEKCEGCRLCLDACPHDAIDFDQAANVAMKCNLCHHRLEKGLYPACADNVCLAHTIRLGER